MRKNHNTPPPWQRLAEFFTGLSLREDVASMRAHLGKGGVSNG